MFWNKSVIARLTSSFLLLSLVIAGVASVVAFVQATDTLEQSVIERLRVAARARQDELDSWVSTQASDLAFIARWEEVLSTTRTIMSVEPASLDYQVAYTRLASTLRTVLVSRPDFAELLVLDARGIVVVSSQRASEGQDLSANDYYRIGRTQTFIQNVYPGPQTERPMMTIATPLLDGLGGRVGVLAVHLNLDRMDRIILDREGLGATGEMYLVGQTSMFVSAQRFGRQEFSRQINSEGIALALRGESGTGRYINYRGIPVIGAYQWLDNFDLALLVEMEEHEAFAPSNRLALSITLSSLVSAGILVFGISILARQIARPILQLTQVAREVASGHLYVAAPVVTQDEIGVLARVFNQMTEQLRGLYEGMEQQVAARTAELTHANTQLTNEIAERTRIEAQLLEAKEVAETANHAKSAFLANMSHELRTPLSSIIGFAQLMQYDKTVKEDHLGYLQIISRSGLHLRDLINDVLEMSKIEADRITLDEDQFVLQEMLNDMMSMFRLRAREQSLELRLDCAANLPTSICADEGKLRQILINLLGNAVKFTFEGHVCLRVVVDDAGCAPDGGPWTPDADALTDPLEPGRILLAFEVEDSGLGISSDDMTELFSPFFQSAETRNRIQGTGLGLAISHKYALLMGGKLSVRSEMGVGSTFRLCLPVTVMDKPVTDGVEPGEQRIVGLAGGQQPYRVLVAEDSDDIRRLLVDMLTTIGFEVRGVENGQACIAEWETWHPHLIWMDIRMPEVNGYEATQYIKRNNNGQHTVIIALTASAFEEERAEILAAGCDDFVRKPFRDTDIFDYMAKHLGVLYTYQE